MTLLGQHANLESPRGLLIPNCWSVHPGNANRYTITPRNADSGRGTATVAMPDPPTPPPNSTATRDEHSYVFVTVVDHRRWTVNRAGLAFRLGFLRRCAKSASSPGQVEDDFAAMGVSPVLKQVNPLPRTEQHPAAGDRH